MRWIHTAVSADDESDELTERDIQDNLTRLLAAPRILIIRNAHRLCMEAAGQLEWLHSHRTTSFSLIIEGGKGTVSAVEREALLRVRIASTVRVLPLHDRHLLDALQSMHPMFLGADTHLLVEIDTRVCHGVLGHWGRFLQVALHLRDKAIANGKEAPVLDRTFAKAVLASLPGTMTKKRN